MCGCQQPTGFALQSVASADIRRGEFRRYLPGHYGKTKRVEPAARGEPNLPRAQIHGTVQKLTEDDVREIRRLLPTTRRMELAERFGVSRQMIDGIARGDYWRGVE